MSGAIREFVSGTATTTTTRALKRERSLQSTARTETDLSYSTILWVTSSMPRLQLTPLCWLLFVAAGTQAAQHLVGLRVNAVHPASIDLGTGIQRGAGHLHHSSFNRVSNNIATTHLLAPQQLLGCTTMQISPHTTTPTAIHRVQRLGRQNPRTFQGLPRVSFVFSKPNEIFKNKTQEQKKILLWEENIHMYINTGLM